jgi:hypothetical protein
MGLLLSGYGSEFSLMFANDDGMKSCGLNGKTFQLTTKVN